MLPFLFLFSQSIHKCNHDELFRDFKLIINPQNDTKKPKLSADPPSIRITYDRHFLDGDWPYNDLCKRVSEVITTQAGQYTCTADDVLTYEKKRVILETFTNVASYLSKYVKVVNPTTTSIPVISRPGSFTVPESWNYSKSNTDFHVVLCTQNNVEFLASAGAISLQYIDKRPVYAVIFFHVKRIPSTPSDIDSDDPSFFKFVLHELTHALCFSTMLFDYWIDPATNRLYEPPPVRSFTFNGKPFTILCTPNFQKWIQVRHGIERFSNRVPAGLEIELDGGSGTAGSHPEQSLYFSDIMAGIENPLNEITELIFLAMLDSGWYKVDFRGAKRMLFGWGPSLGLAPLTNFSHLPYQLNWPTHYLCVDNFYIKRVTFNYRAIGYCAGTNATCAANSTLPFCLYPDFYNPLHTSFIPYSVYDVIYVREYSDEHCQRLDTLNQYNPENAEFEFHIGGPDSYAYRSISGQSVNNLCLITECNADGFTTTATGKNGQSFQCTSDRQLHTSGRLTFECSNPVHICNFQKFDKNFENADIFASGTWNYSDSYPTFVPTQPPIPSSDEDEDSFFEKYGIYVIFGIAALVVIIIVVIIEVYFHRRRKSRDTSSGIEVAG